MCNGGRREWSLDSGFPMDNSGNCLSNLLRGPLAGLDGTVRANGTKATPCCFPTQNTCLENCFHPSRLSSVTTSSRKPSLTAICLPGYFLSSFKIPFKSQALLGSHTPSSGLPWQPFLLSSPNRAIPYVPASSSAQERQKVRAAPQLLSGLSTDLYPRQQCPEHLWFNGCEFCWDRNGGGDTGKGFPLKENRLCLLGPLLMSQRQSWTRRGPSWGRPEKATERAEGWSSLPGLLGLPTHSSTHSFSIYS